MTKNIINHKRLESNIKGVAVADAIGLQFKRIVKLFIYCTVNLLFLSVISCKKLVDVDPPSTQITSDNVYNNDATAIAVLNGLYSKLSSTSYSGSNPLISNISLWAGLSADEFTLWPNTTNTALLRYYGNGLGASTNGFEFWASTYPLIYTCNTAIEGLNKSSLLTPAVKQQLLGEAMFMRAYFYFYLVNLYGDVPLVLTTNYTINSVISRTSRSAVYSQIRSDLNSAKDLLADGYVKSDAMTIYSPASAERVRPSKAAAITLLARVDLYNGDWAKAEMEATEVINKTSLFDIVPLDEVFLMNSMEAIWQLQTVTSGITNTQEGFSFNLSVDPAGLNSNHPIHLSQSLLNSFEAGDERKVNWVSDFTDLSGTYYYPNKYKVGDIDAPVSEYPMFLRLGEVYLIRSESRARLNNSSGAIADLDVIRNRARLPLIADTNPNISQTELLNAILNERRAELFSESGHRWLDLKRSGNIDAVMSTETRLKGGSWHSYQQLYPVGDFLQNPNITQNDGY